MYKAWLAARTANVAGTPRLSLVTPWVAQHCCGYWRAGCFVGGRAQAFGSFGSDPLACDDTASAKHWLYRRMSLGKAKLEALSGACSLTFWQPIGMRRAASIASSLS